MNKITTLNTMRKITLFAMPITAAGLLSILANIFAMLMVARLGHIELAASILAVSTYTAIVTVVVTPSYSVSILISNFKGQGKALFEIGELVRSGFYLALMFALPAVLILWNAGDLLLLFRQDPVLVALTLPYFHFAALSMIPSLLFTVINQFYIGIGKPKFSLYLTILALPLIVLLSYGFILGRLHMPQLGLAGVTCATLIVQTLFVIVILLYFIFNRKVKQYEIFTRHIVPQWSMIKNLFVVGMPIGLQFGGELMAVAILTYLMGHFGVIALAASQIVSQCVMLLVMIMLGLSQTVSVLVSKAYGNNNITLVKQYLSAAVAVLNVAFFFLVIGVAVFHKQFINLYLHGSDKAANQAIFHLTIYFLLIAGVGMWFDSVRNILSGVLRGLHDSKTPMKIGVLGFWFISLPLGYLVAFVLKEGPLGLRIGFNLGIVITLSILYIYLRKNKRLRELYN